MSNSRALGKSSQCPKRSRRKVQRLWQQILQLETATAMVQSDNVAKSRILKPVSGSREIRKQDVSWTTRWMAAHLKVFAGKRSKFLVHWNRGVLLQQHSFFIALPLQAHWGVAPKSLPLPTCMVQPLKRQHHALEPPALTGID